MKDFNEWLNFIEHENKENIKYNWRIYCQYGLSVGSGTMGNLIEIINNKSEKEIKTIMRSDEKYLYCVHERI